MAAEDCQNHDVAYTGNKSSRDISERAFDYRCKRGRGAEEIRERIKQITMEYKRIEQPYERAGKSEREYHKDYDLITLRYVYHIFEDTGVSVGIFLPYAAFSASVIDVQKINEENAVGYRAAKGDHYLEYLVRDL